MDTHLTTQSMFSPCCSPAGSAQEDDYSGVNIPRHETVAAKSLCSRSAMESRQVSAAQLGELILSDGLVDDVSYKVDDYLFINNASDLETLSGNISVSGGLIIRNCPNLKNLTANLSVGGELLIYNCPCLEDLAGTIHAQGPLSVSCAKGLVNVTGNIYVRDSMDMTHCNSLKNISGTVHVNDELDLYRCLSLQDLTGKITVGGILNLGLCHNLTNLSGTISVGDNIRLDQCSSLSYLPDWITSLGYTSRGDIRTIDLELTRLSPALVDQIRSTAAPGMEFPYAEASEMMVNHFQEARQAFAFWREQASSSTEIPNLDLKWEYEKALLAFLRKLTNTDDYNNELSRPVLAQQVMGLLALLMDDQLRAEALSWVVSVGTGAKEKRRALNQLETLPLSRSTESLVIDKPPLP